MRLNKTKCSNALLNKTHLLSNLSINGGLNMKKLFLAVMVCIVCFGTTKTYSTPSTQIWIPSTDIQAFLKPHIGWDAYATTNGNAAAQFSFISNGGLTMGLLPFNKVGLEAGVDYRDLSGTHGNPIYFNAKLGVPEDSLFKFQPAIAIGAYDFGTKKNVTNYNVTYGLLAKTFPIVGRISVGGYKGMGPDVLWTSSKGKVENSGALVSWDRVMSEISDKLWLAIDYQSGNNGYGALSFGGAWNFAPNVGVILGYDIYNDKDLAKPTFTFQVDINAF